MYSWLLKYFEDAELTYASFGNIIILFCSLLVIACSSIYLKLAFKRRRYTKMFPSRKMRFLNPWGNVVDFFNCAKIKSVELNTYIAQVALGYKELFKHEDLVYFGFSYYPFIVLNSAKAVEDLISGAKNTEKSWLYNFIHVWLGTGLLTSNGKKWKTRRKLLTPAFHFDILKEFLPIFNEQSQELVNILRNETEQPWIDIAKPITLCSLDIICETTFGVSIGAQKDSDSEYVKAVTRAIETMIRRLMFLPDMVDWYFYLTKKGSQFKKDIKVLHDFTRAVISEKKRKLLNDTQEKEVHSRKRKAFMDLLLEEHFKNESFTEEDIREEVDTVAFGGHDTTSVAISWALYLIGLHSDVQQKLHEEIDFVFGDDHERVVTTDDLKDLEYLDRVLKECQRLYPSAPGLGRRLTEDTVIAGYKVPKDIDVWLSPYGLHHDETVFPNPEKFDPDHFLPEKVAARSPYAYIPFSAGPRNCIGQRFAVMEVKIIVVNVLRNFSVKSLDPRDKVLIIPDLILRAAGPIRVKLKPRRH